MPTPLLVLLWKAFPVLALGTAGSAALLTGPLGAQKVLFTSMALRAVARRGGYLPDEGPFSKIANDGKGITITENTRHEISHKLFLIASSPDSPIAGYKDKTIKATRGEVEDIRNLVEVAFLEVQESETSKLKSSEKIDGLVKELDDPYLTPMDKFQKAIMIKGRSEFVIQSHHEVVRRSVLVQKALADRLKKFPDSRIEVIR